MSTSEPTPATPAPNTPAASSKPVSGPPTTTPDPPVLYTVNRSQDGAQVRAQLPLADAQSECMMLNAQARMQVGITAPVRDKRGGVVRAAQPIYGSMFQGQVSQYEVRSADGLVVA